MAVVLFTQITLDPNNQIAHIAAFDGLVVGTEYLIAGTFLQADTRFEFHGFSDIALSRQPLGVPAGNTEVPATISDVPMPAAVTPPAGYPYALNDRVIAARLNAAFENNAGTTPPNGNGGTAHLGRIWLDTSGGADTHLRMCKVPAASSGYVAAEWADLFQINTGSGQVQIPGVTGQFVRLTGDVMTGNLTIKTAGGGWSDLYLDTGVNEASRVFGSRNGSPRWELKILTEEAETGTNNGGNFLVSRYADNGSWLGVAMSLNRATGDAAFSSNLSVGNQYQFSGGVFAGRNASHTVIYNGAGSPVMFLGSTSDPTNYYDNNTHLFRLADHGTSLATLTSGGLVVGTPALPRSGESIEALAGGTGHITAHGNITADGTISGLGLYGNSLNINGSGSFTGSVSGGSFSGGSFSGSSCAISSGTIGSFTSTNVTINGNPVCNAGLYVTGAYAGDSLSRTIYCNGPIYVNGEVQSNRVSALGLDGTYSIYLTKQGTGAFLNWYPSIYTSWDQATGTLSYVNSNGLHVQHIASSGFLQNYQGPMAGVGGYVNNSDRRLKENIAPTTRGLPEILGLNPVEFNRITPPGIEMPDVERPLELGFIAQDVYEVLPEAVWAVAEPDGAGGSVVRETEPILGITSETITAALVNAVKTLNERLTALESAR